MVGDVTGKAGRRAVGRMLPGLIGAVSPELVIANAENAAGGTGLTKDTALPLFAAGVNVITLGNHTWSRKETAGYLEEEPRILRPLNYPPGVPGRGWGVFTTAAGERIAVVNLQGRIFMDPIDCPFQAADQAIGDIRAETKAIVVDMHAEATSEKNAMGWYLDGRVSAVVGTHTHIATSDGHGIHHRCWDDGVRRFHTWA